MTYISCDSNAGSLSAFHLTCFIHLGKRATFGCVYFPLFIVITWSTVIVLLWFIFSLKETRHLQHGHLGWDGIIVVHADYSFLSLHLVEHTLGRKNSPFYEIGVFSKKRIGDLFPICKLQDTHFLLNSTERSLFLNDSLRTCLSYMVWFLFAVISDV